MSHELIRFESSNDLAVAVADRWLDLVGGAAAAKQPHRVALAGGRITHDFLQAAASESARRKVPLGAVDFFWGDERCVPVEDPDSNYRLAQENLLGPLKIPAHCVHRIRGEMEPALAARQAGEELRASILTQSNGQPVLDLVFLGMGEDGHVASLFPGAPDRIVHSSASYVDVVGPKPPPRRVSLTFAAIKEAREVWVLASGAGKEAALRESLAGPSTPLGRVLASRTQTVVFTELRIV